MSALTGKPLSGGQIYAPLQHVRTEMCGPSPKVHRDDFEIIDRGDKKYILQVVVYLQAEASTEWDGIQRAIASIYLDHFLNIFEIFV